MPMSLSLEDVREIALHARIRFTDEELKVLAGELGTILEHMNELTALDTSGIEPLTHAIEMTARLRPDEAGSTLPNDVVLGAAPDRAEDYFQVPHVLDGGE